MKNIDRREVLKHTISMMGYTVSAATLTNLAACSERAPKADVSEPIIINGSQPSVTLSGDTYTLFSDEQANTLYTLGDIILPSGDTPGAKDVGAISFVDVFVAHVYDENSRKNFVSGLNSFIARVRNLHDKPYSAISTVDQEALLSVLEDETFSHSTGGEPVQKEFYRRFKGLLINAFYQSKKVGAEILAYDPVPGEFKGCIDFTGKNYSL